MAALSDELVRLFRVRKGVLVFWLLAVVTVPIWVAHDSSAWDLRVYGKALESLQAGHDPYLDATSIQKQHHAHMAASGVVNSNNDPPYSYVYSPVTLPVLRALGHLARASLVLLYWAIYFAGLCTAIGSGVLLGEQRERTALLYVAGVAPFFPGLLANGTVLGGNIAYILYGGLLTAALLGWRRSVWWPFYAAVLMASCVKAPLLSLALIPAFSARRQWMPVLVTIAAGMVLFLGQILLWPVLFRHYLEAVQLQFSFNHDFGCSPAGLFSQILYAHGLPYSPEGTLFYVTYAVPLAVVLFYLSRLYLRGGFTWREWAPVLLLGIILLNPRIMEYDVAPITIPMTIVCWRLARMYSRARVSVPVLTALFAVLNVGSLYSWEWRKELDGALLVLLFCSGCWMLLRVAKTSEAPRIEASFNKEQAVSSCFYLINVRRLPGVNWRKRKGVSAFCLPGTPDVRRGPRCPWPQP